jgi:hypothetical protein
MSDNNTEAVSQLCSLENQNLKEGSQRVVKADVLAHSFCDSRLDWIEKGNSSC